MMTFTRSELLRTGAGVLAAVLFAAPLSAKDSVSTTVQSDVPPLVSAWAEAWNKGDAAGMAALFTADGVYEDYAFQVSWQGREAVSQWVSITAASIPDARIELVEAYQTGNRATARWRFHGTPKRLGEIATDGKAFDVSAVSIFEFENDRIVRVSDMYNLANLLRQIGLDAGPWTPPFGADVLK